MGLRQGLEAGKSVRRLRNILAGDVEELEVGEWQVKMETWDYFWKILRTVKRKIKFSGKITIQKNHYEGFCCCLVAQLCPTLCDPMVCSPPGSSVQGIFQARILGYQFLLHGIFRTQESNLGLLSHAQTLVNLVRPSSVIISYPWTTCLVNFLLEILVGISKTP